MTNLNFYKLIMGFSLLITIISCSEDDSPSSNDYAGSGEIANSKMTLNYNQDFLADYVSLSNSEVLLQRLSGSSSSSYSIEAIESVNNYQQINLDNATVISGNGWYNFNDGGTYVIPEGTTFTGGINFNSAATLYVYGTFGGNNSTNIPNGGLIEVGSTGKILETVSLQLNSGSTLNNYGIVTYKNGSVDGMINNYNSINFTNSYLSFNSSSTVNNDCSLTIQYAQLHINSNLNNRGYALFNNGFHLNGSGNLVLTPGAYAEVTNGSIGVDGKIKNIENGFARLDISNATIGYINANPAVTGQIDINFENTTGYLNLSQKSDSQVTIDGNVYIAGNGCVPEKGEIACNDDALAFSLIASVSSPEIEGITLSATDVKLSNGYAYVSYHTNDEFYGNSPYGALRIFDVSNYENPVLVNQATFNDAEFNGVDISENQLYAVGGNKDGARLITTPLDDNTFNTEDLSYFQTYQLPSATAKNSYSYNGFLWLVTGATNGGLFQLNPSNGYEIENQLYSDGARAKYVAQNGTKQVFFSVQATGAFLRIANVDGGNAHEYTYPTLTQSITNGKNVIALDEDYVYIALSDKGVAKIELATGNLVHHFVPSQYSVNNSLVFTENGYTNGVAVNDCYLYLANGADGVIVLNKNSFNVVGSFKLSESANYVYANSGLLFVATGRNGLNILKID